MRPSELYYKWQKGFKLEYDAQQEALLPMLDNLATALASHKKAGLLRRLFNKKNHAAPPGLYLWGEVGRGKTMLMDILYETLPAGSKLRIHFHRFMKQIHQTLKQYGNQQAPLNEIAAHLVKQHPVICLDEFFVNDIADAMLLHGLLQALFAQGACLITTSNCHPDDLYQNGLQRARFLPAIALLKQHCQVLQLDNPLDYRLRMLNRAHTYFHPLSTENTARMQQLFIGMSSGETWDSRYITVNSRDIPVRGAGQGVIWFDFETLCAGPRSQNDYIEIAREYHTVFLSGIPVLDEQHNDSTRRLLHLIDILYDHRVKLIVSAATTPANIYRGQRLAFEFERAVSRLTEMQTESYLQQPHLP